jgi:hypothetical protein
MPKRSRPAAFPGVARLALLLALPISTGAMASEPDTDDFHTGLVPSNITEVKRLPAAPIYTDYIPARVDLSRLLPPVGDQGGVGSCTAWAVGYAARAMYVSWLEGRDVSKPENIPSPEFIYDSTNLKPGDCEGGSSIVRVVSFLKDGAPSLSEAPYRDRNMLDAKCSRPSAEEGALKRDFFTDTPLSVDLSTVDQAKAELTQGHPVMIGAQIGSAFKHLQAGAVYEGEWKGYYSQGFKQSVPHEQQLGGHAITLVGFDDERQAFKLVNSWGPKWGDQGFGWLSYRAFVDRTIVTEAFTMQPSRAR